MHTWLLLPKHHYTIKVFINQIKLVDHSNTIVLISNCVLEKNKSNFHVSFHWFENQRLHTVHMHLLVWLENLRIINLDRIHATIPVDDSQLVRNLYHFLHLNNNIYI